MSILIERIPQIGRRVDSGDLASVFSEEWLVNAIDGKEKNVSIDNLTFRDLYLQLADIFELRLSNELIKETNLDKLYWLLYTLRYSTDNDDFIPTIQLLAGYTSDAIPNTGEALSTIVLKYGRKGGILSPWRLALSTVIADNMGHSHIVGLQGDTRSLSPDKILISFPRRYVYPYGPDTPFSPFEAVPTDSSSFGATNHFLTTTAMAIETAVTDPMHTPHTLAASYYQNQDGRYVPVSGRTYLQDHALNLLEVPDNESLAILAFQPEVVEDEWVQRKLAGEEGWELKIPNLT